MDSSRSSSGRNSSRGSSSDRATVSSIERPWLAILMMPLTGRLLRLVVVELVEKVLPCQAVSSTQRSKQHQVQQGGGKWQDTKSKAVWIGVDSETYHRTYNIQ
jgi:hypothetical protein